MNYALNLVGMTEWFPLNEAVAFSPPKHPKALLATGSQFSSICKVRLTLHQLSTANKYM